MKLHVGCGQIMLPGYINIDGYDNDHRPDYWAVQPDLIAAADELDRHFEPESVEEIRTHHMFEHIPILQVPKVLTCWNKILKTGGKLIIETPDFEETAKKILETPSEEAKEIYYRCLFGSQVSLGEFHVNGISKGRMRYYGDLFGFTLIDSDTRWVSIKENELHFKYPVNSPLPYSVFLLIKSGPVPKQTLQSNYTHLSYYKRFIDKSEKDWSDSLGKADEQKVNNIPQGSELEGFQFVNKLFQYEDLPGIYKSRYALWLRQVVHALSDLNLKTTSHGTLTMTNLTDQSNWFAHTIYYGRMWEYVKIMQGMKWQADSRTLDCGGASSPLIFAIGSQGYEVQCVDLSEPLVDNTIHIKQKTHWPVIGQVGDMTNLNFPDNSFDNVISCSVIEHLTDEDKSRAMKEMVRVLSPGGRMALSMDWGGKVASGDKSGKTYTPIQDLKSFRQYILDPSGLSLLGKENFDDFDVPVYPFPISVRMPEGWFLDEGIRKGLRPLDRTLAFFLLEKPQ